MQGQGSRRDFLCWTTGSLLLLAGCQRRGGNDQPDPATVRTVKAKQGQTLAMIAAEYNVPLTLPFISTHGFPLGRWWQGRPSFCHEKPVPPQLPRLRP